jgi:hypothetical protein
LVVYTADCPTTSSRIRGISGWIVDSYRPHCYIKPCELEDEALARHHLQFFARDLHVLF